MNTKKTVEPSAGVTPHPCPNAQSKLKINSHFTPRSSMLFGAILTLTLGTPSVSWANGLALNEQSASAAGTAYAGRSSSAIDASTVYGNPAGLSKIKKIEVSGGLALIDAKVNISDARSSAPGTTDGNSVPLTAIPFGYFSSPIDDRFTAGIGLYASYGLVNDYESSFQGRYHGSYSKVQVKTLHPAVSYRLSDQVAIGIGTTFNRIENNIQSYLATGALNDGKDTQLTVKSNGTAVGYNFGLMVDMNESTTWGLTYHSKLDFHADGHTKISDSPGALGLDGKYNNKMDVTLPESVDTSFTHRFDERWTGYAGAIWTRWSRIQRIEAINSGLPSLGQQLGFGSVGDDFKLHNTVSTAIGVSYQLSSQWLLRSGLASDPSPARNSDRSVRLPVGNRKALAFGAAYSPNSDLTIDVAYTYLWESTTSVNQSDTNGLQPGFSAKYNNSAHIIAAQLTHRF
ncbi:outer membrane protein transport protein [Pseudomonas sp. CVAP|uniref:outer membrane protein transport protein n=1 Tax=Pseudomonas sp. CVAP\